MNSYVGLDLSLTSTGLFILREDGSNKHLEIKTEPKNFTCLVKRVKFIAERILQEISGEKVKLVLLEDCYASGGVYAGTGLMLSALGTMVRDRLLSAGYQYLTATPGQIKKFETGNGSAGKELMLKCSYKNHNVDVTSNNVADACAMAYFCQGFCEWKKGKTDFFKYQIEVLKGIKVPVELPY